LQFPDFFCCILGRFWFAPCLIMLVRFCFCLFLVNPATALEFHVSPSGREDASGTKEAPFGTLTQARDAIRILKKKGGLNEAVTVWVHGGIYEMSDTLALDVIDSGSEKFPMVYRNVEGDKPVFIGAPKVEGFSQHQGQILKADIKGMDFGKAGIRQLLFNGKRQPLARYPNADPADPLYAGWAFLKDVPKDKIEGHAWKRVAYLDSKDVREWAKPWELEINIFAGYGWWNFIMPVATVDRTENTITLKKDCGYDLHPHNRYFIQNALEELDAPGEWYIDRGSDTLYFWPPASGGEVRIPKLESFVKMAAATKHITIRGLHFTGCTQTAVSMSGAENCTIAGCVITEVGGWNGAGISMHGKNNVATGNEVSFTGSTGISVAGGDRLKLESGNNVADNNHVHHPGMIQKNGAGIGLGGVGNKATHNHIHHTPRMAVQFTGNNLVIDYNHMHHTVLETQDGGAVYTGGRDWISSRGTSLKYNFIHDTIGVGQGSEGLKHPHFTWGIYMDDNAGGLDIVGNIVVRSARAGLHLHNGRDHIIENNIFVDGGERQVEYSGWSGNHLFFKKHHQMMIDGWDKVKDQPAWKSMRNMDFNPRNAVLSDGTIMSGNFAQRNIIAWKDASVRYADLKSVSPEHNKFNSNLVWNGSKEIRTSVTLTGKDTGPELMGSAALLAATPEGKVPKGWGWNHKPKKILKLQAEPDNILRVEAATSEDPKNTKVSLHSPSMPAKAGGAYRAKMKLKGTKAGMRGSFSYAIFSAGNGYWQSDAKGFTVGTDWQEFELTGVMLRESDPKWKPWMNKFFIRVDLADSDGEVLIKDLNIHEAQALDGWTSWQSVGWDLNSIIADPLFENPEKDDYRLKKDSPAFKLGFKQIPVEKIGQYPSELRAKP
jgi:hypothetical protein